ncbi:hypothetical protein PIIN_10605 [Serendipita indica DSM 11827]|uniref:Uncharacterized protein n=1 Tax=Serendipita indica (strain DSM 11827) TaxID=1109443 RepID=G4TZ71_SERID|nr:hypothetical protein PIIN_10605 [Serendipita indica DSM 11827]
MSKVLWNIGHRQRVPMCSLMDIKLTGRSQTLAGARMAIYMAQEGNLSHLIHGIVYINSDRG